MIRSIFDELRNDRPKNHFTIGINDDVTHTSLVFDETFNTESSDVTRAVFWGLGSDGTVGANKNSIKIIGEGTDHYAQGYFVYDSKKSGARTISHLRFGPRPIQSTYLIGKANFVAVHQFGFLDRVDTLTMAEDGAIFLLNSPFGPEKVWDHLPRSVQQQIIEKNLRFYVIDAYQVAREARLGIRINTIMQTCFFALSGVLPREEALYKIKEAITKTYGKRGPAVVRMNHEAVDQTLSHLFEVVVPAQVTSGRDRPAVIPDTAPAFVRDVTGWMIAAGEGDKLPVSALPIDGTYPVGTTKWEKRNLALEIPVWEPDICIQCGKCVVVCPHAVIRAKVYDPSELEAAPDSFKSTEARWQSMTDTQYTLQVAPEDCTGCKLCVEICPAKDKSQVGRKALNMAPQSPLREAERTNWDFFLGLPGTTRLSAGGDGARPNLSFTRSKDVQLLDPLFEFSGACAGCGETPYLSLMTRFFGDRSLVANATGCSSIFGGNLPTTPWSCNAQGRGPAWSNSLFEDNAEFGLGMRLALDKQQEYAFELVTRLQDRIGTDLATALREADQSTDDGIASQRERVAVLKQKLEGQSDSDALDLFGLADALVRKNVWIVGGDGWAYDIGYGGLDHVLASGKNVNVLVLDTEVYSNTGGQASKATGLGAVAKFAAGGKATPKKDLGLLAMGYGYVYVAQVAMGANDTQCIKAFLEAEAYDGPSLIIAYSHCIAHGIDMTKGLSQQELAVRTGYWPLYRFDPELKKAGKNPFQLDSKAPGEPLRNYIYNENRYRMLLQSNPEAAEKFAREAQGIINDRWKKYELMAHDGQPKESRNGAKPGPPKMPPGTRPKPAGIRPAGPGKLPPRS
jgi:pyruvate-ferredoxin/flavodoxin oxidoreductase